MSLLGKIVGAALAVFIAFWVGYGVKAVIDSQSTAKTTRTSVKVATAANPPTRAELLKLVNEQRAKVGVAPLTEDPRLDWSAQQKADDEVKYDYFGHLSNLSPNDNGDSRQWLLASGIQCADTSENLVTANTSELAISWWMGSTSHKDAMLNPKYSLTGFGIKYAQFIPKANEGSKVEDKSDIANTYIVTEHFCQP